MWRREWVLRVSEWQVVVGRNERLCSFFIEKIMLRSVNWLTSEACICGGYYIYMDGGFVAEAHSDLL